MKHLKKVLAETEKNLVSLKAYLPEDKEIENIIQFCQLSSFDSWRTWSNNIDYVLKITEDKKILIREKCFDKIDIIDIYHKSFPKQLVKISSKMILAFNDSDCFIWFLGKDKILRLSVFIKDKWVNNLSPLACGMKSLRYIVKNLKVEQSQSIDFKALESDATPPLNNAWISTLPITDKIKAEMLLANKELANHILTIFDTEII